MEKYFANPELKRSSLVIAAMIAILLAATFLLLKIGYNSLKNNYVENNMALVGELVSKHPELKKDIIPIITKGPSDLDIAKGRKILSRYDYDETISREVISSIDRDYIVINTQLFIVILLSGAAIFLFNYMHHAVIYRKVKKLILASENIANLNYKVDIYEDKKEGAFSKLAAAFGNMRDVVKNNYNQVSKEKSFLVNILSDISHQLKTPIASLIVYNDILLNRNVDENKRKTFLENSRNQLNRIEWLVKSLLQLAKLDAGVIKFEKIRRDLNITVEDAVKALSVKASTHNINLVVNKNKDELFIEHDANWLSEAIINIIKNAIEHTSSNGLVKVTIEKTAVCIRIIIQDDGEGISKEELPHIFERFYKGRENKNAESVGIGLALSKSIVEGHGGIIEVKSSKGSGTTFSIVFLG